MLRLDELVKTHVMDLRDASAVAAAVAEAQPEMVPHLMAQPQVHPSMIDLAESLAVNVLGTLHALDVLHAVPGSHAVLVVTTDKVYADLHAVMLRQITDDEALS